MLLTILLLVLTGCGMGTTKETSTAISAETVTEQREIENFSCYALDTQGKELFGYRREKDGSWYLFVPSTQSISDLEIYYTGTVSEVSSGALDTESGVVIGAFSNGNTQVEFRSADGAAVTVIAMQSELPAVQIYLKDTTLDIIHQDKDERYKGNTVLISDPNGTYNLCVEASVEIKGRGNSSWREYEKKGYQIKFDEKTDVFGMGKAKKWVLLANASDDSMIRTQLVYQMAKNLDMAFVPEMQYIDLWIDGEYLGTYMIGEKIEIGGSRLDLEHPEGGLFEHDENFFAEEDYWLYNERIQRHFTLKEIVEEEDAMIEASMESFDKSIDELMMYLYSTPPKQATLESLSQMIDVDSFAKYYLINEYVMNRESYATSFYWYQDGPNDVLHMGPIWDYDTCMGNDGTTYKENYGDKHLLYWLLLTGSEFRGRVECLYAQYKDELDAMTDNVNVLKDEIYTSAEMNYLRWDVLGTASPKNPDVMYADTFEEAVASVEKWLAGREKNFNVPATHMATSIVSEDRKTVDVYFEPEKKYNKVRFMVWSMESDPREVHEFKAEQTNGIWHATVDLTLFNTTGMYSMDVYANNDKFAISNGFNYIETIDKQER